MSNYEAQAARTRTARKDNEENSDNSTHVFYQYIGTNWLIAVGPATKTYYRFDWPGAVVAVDLRDQSSLEVIPQLQQLYGFKTSVEEDLPLVS